MAMKKKLLIGLIATLSWGVSSAETVLNVGLIDQDRSPYFYRSGDNGQIRGAYIDILNIIGEKLDVSFTYKQLPQARIRLYMKNGQLDLEPGIAQDWRLEPGEIKATVYTDTFYRSEEVIVYNPKQFKQTKVDISDFDQLIPCSILGFNDFKLINVNTKNEIATEKQSIHLLKLNRCDYALFPIDVIKPEIEQGYLERTKPVAIYNLRFRLAKKYQYLLPEFNRQIKLMTESGEITRIMNEHTE